MTKRMKVLPNTMRFATTVWGLPSGKRWRRRRQALSLQDLREVRSIWCRCGAFVWSPVRNIMANGPIIV